MGENPPNPLGAFRFNPIGNVPPHTADKPNLGPKEVRPEDIINFYLKFGIDPRKAYGVRP